MASQPLLSKSLGTVLVVGGCGFLGSHIVDQLLNFPSESQSSQSPPRLTSTSTLSTGGRPDPASLTFPTLCSRYPSYTKTAVHVLDLTCTRNRYPGATYHEADITSPSDVLAIFRLVKPDLVINTASPHFDAPRPILLKVNVTGTKTLVEVAGGVHGSWGGNCKAFVHTSSSSVIHDALSDLNRADERWPYVFPNPREYYSETKVQAERLVLEANDEHNGMLTCAIRPAGIIGENDAGGISHGLLLTASVAPDWQLHFQLGNGDNLFDTTYVGNVAYGHLLAAEGLLKSHARIQQGKARPLDHEKVDGEAFIVTNDAPAYFWDTARYIWTIYGREISMAGVWSLPEGLASAVGAAAEGWAWISGRKGKLTRQSVKYSCMHRTYSCDKLQMRCGYEPLVGVEEGLQRAVRSFVINERAAKKVETTGEKQH